jgi:hypothetical protein
MLVFATVVVCCFQILLVGRDVPKVNYSARSIAPCIEPATLSRSNYGQVTCLLSGRNSLLPVVASIAAVLALGAQQRQQQFSLPLNLRQIRRIGEYETGDAQILILAQ